MSHFKPNPQLTEDDWWRLIEEGIWRGIEAGKPGIKPGPGAQPKRQPQQSPDLLATSDPKQIKAWFNKHIGE
jgi:hypothetical protein